MKRSFLALITAAVCFSIFGISTGCQKSEKCEFWVYNIIVSKSQAGCSASENSYNLTKQVCGDDLSSARNHATVIESKNGCYTSYIQYVRKVN